MSIIKVISFEDDPLHSDILRINLQNLGYKNCGIFPVLSDAVRLVASISPDIILMDIAFNGKVSGIDMARKLANLFNVPLIFLSSLPIKSIINDIITTLPESYLVKPFSEEQLRSAIEVAIYKYQHELTNNSQVLPNHGQENSFYIKVDKALTKINFMEIVYIEALDKYSIIYTKDNKYTILNQLGQLAGRLSPVFVRVHRSYIVNVQAIKKIRMVDNTIDMGLKVIPFSKMYKQKLFDQLNIL